MVARIQTTDTTTMTTYTTNSAEKRVCLPLAVAYGLPVRANRFSNAGSEYSSSGSAKIATITTPKITKIIPIISVYSNENEQRLKDKKHTLTLCRSSLLRK